LNTNVLAAIHVTAEQLDAKQSTLDAANRNYAIQLAAAQKQAAIAQAQAAQVARNKAAFLQQNSQPQSRYTGLNADGSGQPNKDLMNYNATNGRTGWDGKNFHDNQSQGNFIGN